MAGPVATGTHHRQGSKIRGRGLVARGQQLPLTVPCSWGGAMESENSSWNLVLLVVFREFLVKAGWRELFSSFCDSYNHSICTL